MSFSGKGREARDGNLYKRIPDGLTRIVLATPAVASEVVGRGKTARGAWYMRVRTLLVIARWFLHKDL
jgi:hypothetical protein